jgi:TP901 family phage tail tape measure protein
MTDTANLNIDPSGVVTGVKKIESSINELFRTFKTFTSSLDTLNNAATKSMGSMYDELTIKAAKGENGLEQVRLDALVKMKADTRARLNVASGENTEIQRLYDSRLATASTLSNQELNVWKKFGANLGAIQKAQLQGTELAYLQGRLERAQEITSLASHLANVEAASVKLRAAYDKAVSGKRKSSELKAQLKEAEAEVEASRIRLAALNDAFDKSDVEAIARHNALLVVKRKAHLSEIIAEDRVAYELGEALYKSYVAEVTAAEKTANAAAVARRKAVLADIISEDKAAYELGEALYKSYVAEVTAAEKLANATAVARRKAHLADIIAEDKAAYELNEAILKSYLAEVTAAEKAAAKYANALHDDMLRDEIRYHTERAAIAKAGSKAVVAANNSINGMDFKPANAGLRGLTQGFGMLSIGISSMLPFLASFAAGFAFINTIKVGVQFEKSMFEIQELAGASTKQMDSLRESISKLADTTQYKPTEMAEGLSILSLAGLNANEAMTALVPTLNFAAAGGVRLEAAAGTLVAVGTAYGYSSDKFTTVADVIAKTAADTMSSVTNMSEAFKTSSVVAQQYGLTLDDTARSLGMLAQIGITGSAAGTSYRNMITEFNKGTGRAAEAIKKMGVQVTDTTGATRPLSLVMRELTAGLIAYTGASQQRILQDMTTERGAKSTAAYQAAALIQMNKMMPTLQREIDYLRQSGKEAEAKAYAIEAVGKAYAELDEKAAKAKVSEAGMAFFANLEKQFKPAEQLSGIAASLQEAFLKTFKALEAPLFNLGQEIRNLFKSDDFRNGLTTVASLMLNVVDATVAVSKFLIENSKAVLTAAAAYVGWKLALVSADIALIVGTATFAAAAMATKAFAAAMAVATGAANALTLSAALAGSTFAISGAAVLAITAGVVALGVAVVALTGYWLLSDTAAEKALNAQRDAANARRKVADAEVKALETQMSIQAEQLDASNRGNLRTLYDRQNNAKLTEIINDKTFQAFKARKEGELGLEKKLLDSVAMLKKSLVTEAQMEEKTRVDAANARIDMWVKEKEMILEAIRLNQIWGLTGLLGGGKSLEEAEAIADERYSNSLARIKGEAVAQKTGMAERIRLSVELQTKLAELDKKTAGTPRVVGGETYGSSSPAEQTKAQIEARTLKAKEDALLKVTDAIEKFNKGTSDMEQSLQKVTTAEMFEITVIQLLDKAVAMGAITWQNANKVIKEIEAAKAKRDDAEEVNGIQKIIDATVLLNEKLQSTLEVNTQLSAAESLKAQLSVASSKLTKEEAKVLADKAKMLLAVSVSLEAAKKDQEAYNKSVQDSINMRKEIRVLVETINVQSKAEKALEANRAEALRQGPEFLAKLEAETAITEKYSGQIAKFTESLELQEAAYNKVRDASDSWELIDKTELTRAREQLDELIALVAKLRGEAGDNALAKALTTQRDVFSSSLADAVMVGLEQGTEAGVASMRKVIEDEFLRKPIQLWIKATISEIMGGKGGNTSVGGVIAGIADGSTLTKLANLGQNLVGTGSINASVGKFVTSSMGETLGLSTANSVAFNGGGPMAQTFSPTTAGSVASNLPYMAMLTAYQQGGVGGFASGAASIALGGTITGGISALTAGTSVMAGAASGLTAALAAVPVYGWVALGAAALLGIGNKKFETTYGGDFTADQSGLKQTRSNGTGGNFANQVMEKSILGTTININSMLAGLGSKASVTSLSGGANSNMEKAESYSFAGGTLSTGQTFGSPTRLSDNLGKMAPEDVLKAFGIDLKRATLQALQAVADVPVTVADMMKGYDLATMKAEDVDAFYEVVNKVITDTQGLQGALKTLPFSNLTDLSFDAAAGLIKFSGGLEALSTNLTGYYDNYYTAEEKRAQSITNITRTLNAAGVAVTEAQVGAASRDDFRDLFESLKDLSGPEAQMAASAMLSVQGAFAELTPAAQEVRKTFQQLVKDAKTMTAEATEALVGFDAAGLGKMMLDAAFNPQAGMSAAQSFAVALETSIRQTLINSVVGDIASAIFRSIVVPMVAGAALADGAVEKIVRDSKAKLEVLGAIFASQAFKDGLANVANLVAGLIPPIQQLSYQSNYAVVAVDSLTTSVGDLGKAAETSLKDARTGVQALRDEATDRYVTAQEKVIVAQQNLANAIHSTVKNFKDFLGTLDNAQAPTERLAGARQKFEDLSTKARDGDMAALTQLPAAAKSFLDLSKGYSKTVVDYRRDEAKVRITMEEAIFVGNAYLKTLPEIMQEVKDPITDAADKLADALVDEADARVEAIAIMARLEPLQKTIGERYLELIKELTPEEEKALNEMYTKVTGAYKDLKELGIEPNLASKLIEKAATDKLAMSGGKLGSMYDELTDLLKGLDIPGYFKSLATALIDAGDVARNATSAAKALIEKAAQDNADAIRIAAAAAAARAAASAVGPTQGPQIPYTGPAIPVTGGGGLVTEPVTGLTKVSAVDTVITNPAPVVTPAIGVTPISTTLIDASKALTNVLGYNGTGTDGATASISGGVVTAVNSGGNYSGSLVDTAKIFRQYEKANGTEAAMSVAADLGFTGSGLQQILDAAPKFAKGGYHSGGLRLVGENGPELESTGPSRIYTAEQTRIMLGNNNDSNNAEILAELKALREEVRLARQNSTLENNQIIPAVKKVANYCDRWNTIGVPTTVVA